MGDLLLALSESKWDWARNERKLAPVVKSKPLDLTRLDEAVKAACDRLLPLAPASGKHLGFSAKQRVRALTREFAYSQPVRNRLKALLRLRESLESQPVLQKAIDSVRSLGL